MRHMGEIRCEVFMARQGSWDCCEAGKEHLGFCRACSCVPGSGKEETPRCCLELWSLEAFPSAARSHCWLHLALPHSDRSCTDGSLQPED